MNHRRINTAQYKTASDVIKELNDLHDSGLSWRKIAELPQYAGMKAGTLCSIASGARRIPEKYKAQLGLPYEVKATVDPIKRVIHFDGIDHEEVKLKKRKPAWLLQAVENLARLEAQAKPSQNRTYDRNGRRVT